MHLILLWALVGLIGRAHGKCSLAPIVDDERSIAYACIHGDLNDLAEISSEAVWIEFSVARIHSIPNEAFARFRNLTRLSFYNCHINGIEPDAFSGLNRLAWLVFHGTRIHVARATWFRHLPNLRRLVLDRCGLVHLEPEVFRALPRLETLGVRDNDLDCLPIEELSYLRALRAVRVDGNPWLCECRQRMDRFFKERRIVQEEECAREIEVYRNVQCMTQIGIPTLPLFPTTPRPYVLDSERPRGNEFETTVLGSLDRLPDKTTWIEISGLRMEHIPRYTFFRFGNSLRSLDLNECSIGNVEQNAFAGLHRLQRLSLVGNRFPVIGADWFSDLVALQQLILQRNGIERIEKMAFRHVADSLRYLDIRNNRLRCLPLEELAVLRKLERVEATGNPWTCACRRDLESFLTDRNVGFEINGGQCYETENEIPVFTDDRQTTIESESHTGRVHWSSFEESIREMNTTIVRATPPPPTTQVYIATTRPPPVYQGSCRPEKGDRSVQTYVCSGITSLEELGAIPHTIRAISVILSNLGAVPENSFARFNGYLSRLELRDCGIAKVHYRAFAGLYNLEYLSLHSNQLDSVTSDTLEGLSNLRHLNLSRNHIYRITNDAFNMVPYLTSLDVSDNLMNCIGVEHMSHRLPYLSSLRVSNNPWSCLCGTKLANFLDQRRMAYDRKSLLDMNEECYASRPTVTPPVATVPQTSLRTTTPVITTTEMQTIEGTCVSYDEPSGGLRYRCTAGNLLLLQIIPSDVVAIEFHEGHLPSLPAGSFSRFTNLRELIIRNSGLRTMEQGTFEGLNKLENLTIQDNPMDMLGSSWIALENLERLDLRGNSIRYIAPGAFRRLNRLSYLNLEGNDLKCIFTSDLDDMPNVYVVEFSGNPLKWRCRVELEQFLEMRKIRFVRVENSCEGKKLVRNLLYANRTNDDSDCSAECSMAARISHPFLAPVALLACSLMLVH